MPNKAVQFRIEKTLSLVPRGKVVSYGLLADLCGLPGRARMMGKCLREISIDCNWHRVLRSDGKIAFPAGSEKAEEQRQRLITDGVLVKNYRVNMKKFGWTPDLLTILVELEY
ncbi:MGMT family protein [Alteromonas sp. ALT199]|uniref:MGMT family protein n=1 Tax=unclassified Alteromonas TaxID=2614992 RepID=UPI0004471A97|nr:MGMT family protein [Alteromonas sp. ALT199]MBT3133803.1 MGMT family protein [Alteromonas sp. ALT199]